MKAYYAQFDVYDVFMNMAIDEYLYMKIDEPVIRFYVFERPSLTIGFNQRYARSCNTEYVEREGVPLTRRITGGRTVYHCGDLTYSFSSSFNAFKYVLGSANNLGERYRILSEAFVKGFKNAGIDVEVNASKGDKPYAENCFDSTSLYEITVEGNKILGSAQTFLTDRFMQQGTILVNQCPLDAPIFKNGFKSNNIENITDMLYNIEDLSEHFYNAFNEMLPFEWETVHIDTKSAEITELYNKYSNMDWIRRR